MKKRKLKEIKRTFTQIRNIDDFKNFLVKKLEIGENSLCFCGRGKKYKRCCRDASIDDLLYCKKAFQIDHKYRKSQGILRDYMPRTILKEFQKRILARFACLFPHCLNVTISCHFIPENILRKNFGGHCKKYEYDDKLDKWLFTDCGVASDAECYPIFCKFHDNNIFKNIDQHEFDPSSQEELFIISFKALAFSLRKTQFELSIESQFELARPFYMQKLFNLPNNQVIEIDTSKIRKRYLNYVISSDYYKEATLAYGRKNWNYFSSFYRKIAYTKQIFYGGFFGLSSDLEGKRINWAKIAVAMSCYIFTKDNYLHVTPSTPGDQGKISYQPPSKQPEAIDEETFIAVINNILTLSAEKPPIATSTTFSDEELQKIPALQKLHAECMLTSSTNILDLKNSEQSIQFIHKT